MSMRDVDHTDPNSTENTFGRMFRRGPGMADGGDSPSGEAEEEAKPMREVNHEHPDGPDANSVWERGSEGAAEE